MWIVIIGLLQMNINTITIVINRHNRHIIIVTTRLIILQQIIDTIDLDNLIFSFYNIQRNELSILESFRLFIKFKK